MITGRIGQDASVNSIGDGRVAINFSVCHTETYKNKNNEKVESPHWIRCSWFVKEGTRLQEILRKGNIVTVQGMP